MDIQQALYGFMERICEDPRIGPSHISLFAAILDASRRQNGQMPVTIYSKKLMKQAKISGIATYYKCIRELKEYGYIGYTPCYNPVLGSLVEVL